MNDLSVTVAAGLSHYFEDFRFRVHQLSGRLTAQQYWSKPYPYGNSFGNLVLHLTGNLNYYIGSRIEGTGYVRNRELEFTAVHSGDSAESLRWLDDAVALVISSLNDQSAEDWSCEYSAEGVDDVHDRFSIYVRCCVHFHHHIGQMTYLVKEWNRACQEHAST